MATKNTAAKAAPSEVKAAPAAKAAKPAAKTAKPAIKLVKSAASEAVDVKVAAVKAKVAKPAKAPKVKAEEAETPSTLNRSKLADGVRAILHSKHGIGVSPTVAVLMVESLEEAITSALTAGVDVALPTLGKFKVNKREGGNRRNPSTGETFEAPASWVAYFKASKGLKTAVNSRPME